MTQLSTEAGLYLSKAFAQWIGRTTLVWNTPADASVRCALEYARGESADDIFGGRATSIPLMAAAGGLPEPLRVRYPHLTAHQCFCVAAIDAGQLREALTSPLIATRRDDRNHLLAATAVQIAGVLDDVFAAAATQQLGPTWDGNTPRLAVWAPTARLVALNLYDTPLGGSYRSLPMRRDDTTGIWSVTGQPAWNGTYYTYLVKVYAPSIGAVVANEVTDPYSLSLSANSVRSQLINLSDPALEPRGWQELLKPPAVRPEQASIYELHVREFSATDATIPAPLRGTYSAFTVRDGAGITTLRELAADGLTHVQLMPVSDFVVVPERREQRMTPSCDLATLPPDSDQQQRCITAIKNRGGYSWGYNPFHYLVPEGSYSTDPDGPRRITDFRALVAALNEAGLRVVIDGVYNHTHAAGQHADSVLDRIVPGYYQRLRDDGEASTDAGGQDTAPEHLMMGKLVIDSVVTWATQYKVDGFRFDLMSFHPKANIVAIRAALDVLTQVDGRSILLYGEGWNFGDVADDARFTQATQRNMAGTGIGTFNDQLRDAVRGGSPMDADPRVQGFGSGLFTAPNGADINGDSQSQRARLLHYQKLIEIGLAGNLESYQFADSPGMNTPIDETGYNAEPGEAITYVDCHDNETLFDALAHKLPQDTSMANRVRMQSLSLAVVLLSQGPAFVLAGSDRLRSKSLDRNSYNSGDWFNRLLWDCQDGNGFGAGLPPASYNQAYWVYDKPLLADRKLRPDCAAINTAHSQFREFLRIRRSSLAFSLGSATEIQRRISFPAVGIPGVIIMRIETTGLDPRWKAIIVVFNATIKTHTQSISLAAGEQVTLHPVQANSLDPIVRQSAFDAAHQTITVPARTVTVFTQS
jgi:pullulanase-type alpha-1,6-glucosidase